MKRLDTYGSNSPTQPGKVPIPRPSGTDNGQMPVGCPGVCWNLRIEMATAIIVPLCTLVYKPTQESKARGIFSQVFRCRTEIIKEIRQNSSLVTPTNHPLQKPGKGCRSEVQPTKFGNNWKIITGNNLGIIFYLFAFVNWVDNLNWPP